jgi:thiol:disulfide interchange protein DsbD
MLRALILLLWLLVPQPGITGTNDFGNMFTEDREPTVLEPDQAFQLSVQVEDATTLRANFVIAPGHYLYRDRISFTLEPGTSSKLADVELPPGEAKHDPNFGNTVVFHQGFEADLHLEHTGEPPQRIKLLASYQGCSKTGLCYSPIRKTLTLDLPVAERNASPASETDAARALMADGKLWLIAAGFFGFGLLLAFTPCVFPMIPILSSIIVGQDQHPTRMHAFYLSLAYTLGMAVTYTLAGIAAAFSGQLISSALQNPWALGVGAALFVLLALSMFGLYELRLPSGLETRLAGLSNRFKGGRFAGVLAMGALSALILSPCVAAPLAGALLYIGQTHDVFVGGVALFALSMGMGVPLLLLGASAGALLPKSGAWMNSVRNVFGVVMLAMAIWLIGPVIPPTLKMGLWATLMVVCAVYLHALDGLPPQASGWLRLWKGVGVIALICGIALLIGALAGSRNLLQPLAGLRGSATMDTGHALTFRQVKDIPALETALKRAHGKYVMLDFYADWCVSCKEYEQFTFRDPRVGKLLENAVLLQADVTQNSSDDAALLARFGLFGPPGIIFFDPNGNEVTALKVVGYQDAEQFLVTLNNLYASKDGECAAALEC